MTAGCAKKIGAGSLARVKIAATILFIVSSFLQIPDDNSFVFKKGSILLPLFHQFG
ncbi:hypothetical protein AVDCRST_MAG92-3567 [uncultured Coleofasciculus sp.]|uniref:Uncharacterized protein n=1 Tax=uncultured Coleofasciculus sp. TaxID=1267456 RepID=A0A6J4JLA5_9CYAN|nr:hypothetical protein AVDCRST_MAG92-3567 [uncultured Coleofasciculus sp.]